MNLEIFNSDSFEANPGILDDMYPFSSWLLPARMSIFDPNTKKCSYVNQDIPNTVSHMEIRHYKINFTLNYPGSLAWVVDISLVRRVFLVKSMPTSAHTQLNCVFLYFANRFKKSGKSPFFSGF